MLLASLLIGVALVLFIAGLYLGFDAGPVFQAVDWALGWAIWIALGLFTCVVAIPFALFVHATEAIRRAKLAAKELE